MEEKMTMEITNDRLEEAIKEYAADRTKERLTTVLNLLRPTKLFVPAMLQAPDRPIPCFLKNTNSSCANKGMDASTNSFTHSSSVSLQVPNRTTK